MSVCVCVCLRVRACVRVRSKPVEQAPLVTGQVHSR